MYAVHLQFDNATAQTKSEFSGCFGIGGMCGVWLIAQPHILGVCHSQSCWQIVNRKYSQFSRRQLAIDLVGGCNVFVCTNIVKSREIAHNSHSCEYLSVVCCFGHPYLVWLYEPQNVLMALWVGTRHISKISIYQSLPGMKATTHNIMTTLTCRLRYPPVGMTCHLTNTLPGPIICHQPTAMQYNFYLCIISAVQTRFTLFFFLELFSVCVCGPNIVRRIVKFSHLSWDVRYWHGSIDPMPCMHNVLLRTSCAVGVW